MIGIIGGAGFLGSKLSQVLSEKKIEHKILDLNLEGKGYIDITDPKTFGSLEKVTIIINLAAEHKDNVSPKNLYDLVNVQGSKNLCDFASKNGINKIIFTSSVAVYGLGTKNTNESGDINYFNDYGRTKFLAEEVYRKWYQEDKSKRDLIIIRPGVIFGEQNRGNVYNLIRQIAKKRFVMFGSGKNTKSMAYVENVAKCLNYITSLEGYHLYNYVDKPDFDMNSLVRFCRRTLFGKDNVGVRLPVWLGKIIGLGFDLLGYLSRSNLPISSIRVKKFMETTSFSTSISTTGFSPSINLEEGLEKTLKYEFLENKD